MRWQRRVAGRAASGTAVVGLLIAGIGTCARIARVADRGSDAARAVSRLSDAGSASSRLGRIGRAGRAASTLDEFAEACRARAIPGRGVSPRQLEELGRMESELREVGWREGVDALRTADLVRGVLSRCGADDGRGARAGYASADVLRRSALLQSQSADLRVAALTVAAEGEVGEHLLYEAGVRLHDSDARVRIAAARLIGERAPPLSSATTSLSLAVETERDPEVLAAFRHADDMVQTRFRAMLEERRRARR